jgi:hypothetical protein
MSLGFSHRRLNGMGRRWNETHVVDVGASANMCLGASKLFGRLVVPADAAHQEL